MKTAKEFLYHRLVIMPDGFHDHDSYVEQMRGGYEEQIIEVIESYAEQKLQQHGVMQAEGSDGAEGATVASGAVGKGVCDGGFTEKEYRTVTSLLKKNHL